MTLITDDQINELTNALQLCITSQIMGWNKPNHKSVKNVFVITFTHKSANDAGLKKFDLLMRGQWGAPLNNGRTQSYTIQNFDPVDISLLTSLLMLTRLQDDQIVALAEQDPRYRPYAATLGLLPLQERGSTIMSLVQARDFIFQAIEKKKVSLTELAKQTHLSQVSLSNFKAGGDMRLSNLLKIAKALGIKLMLASWILFSFSTLASASVTQEQVVKIAPGTAQLFFVKLGTTRLATLSNDAKSPLLQDVYFKWSLRWVPDMGEGVNFLSPIMSRCEAMPGKLHHVTCVDQFRLVVREVGVVQSITFLNPRYHVVVNGKGFGFGSSWTDVETALGRKLQQPNIYDPDKSECIMAEGTPSCCPKELQNICINFTYDKLPADGGKLVVDDWTLMAPGKK